MGERVSISVPRRRSEHQTPAKIINKQTNKPPPCVSVPCLVAHQKIPSPTRVQHRSRTHSLRRLSSAHVQTDHDGQSGPPVGDSGSATTPRCCNCYFRCGYSSYSSYYYSPLRRRAQTAASPGSPSAPDSSWSWSWKQSWDWDRGARGGARRLVASAARSARARGGIACCCCYPLRQTRRGSAPTGWTTQTQNETSTLLHRRRRRRYYYSPHSHSDLDSSSRADWDSGATPVSGAAAGTSCSPPRGSGASASSSAGGCAGSCARARAAPPPSSSSPGSDSGSGCLWGCARRMTETPTQGPTPGSSLGHRAGRVCAGTGRGAGASACARRGRICCRAVSSSVRSRAMLRRAGIN